MRSPHETECQEVQTILQEVQYLEHTVLPEVVTKDPKKLEAIKSWPPPTDKHKLRCFLRLCMHYRRFIPIFTDIAKPLTRLTEEK
jgi:hypothetical protein